MLTHHACDPFLGWGTLFEHHPNDENLLSKNRHEQKGSNQWLWMGQKKGHAMSLDVPTQMIGDHLFHNTCVACSSSPLSNRSLLLGHWHWTMMKGLKRLHGQGFDAWNVCVFSGCVRCSQSWSTAPLLCYVCACCSRKPADVLGSKLQPFWFSLNQPWAPYESLNLWDLHWCPWASAWSALLSRTCSHSDHLHLERDADLSGLWGFKWFQLISNA